MRFGASLVGAPNLLLPRMSATSSLHAVVLRVDDALLEPHTDVFGPSAADRVVALAHALATSPTWAGMRERARIVVRHDKSPIIGAVGHVQDVERPRLEALGWQAADTLRRLHPASWQQSEEACECLAEQLRTLLGRACLSRARLIGLPRGGLIVAGLLAYLLNLDHEQLDATDDARDTWPLIVVDDCMLSGTQLRRWLRRHPDGPPVVVAHLHSHPALRDALTQRERRVTACVAGQDLHDRAVAERGTDYEDWRRRWEARTPESYWTGQPDHICYPWNEPDVLIWNPAVDAVEPGWRVVPPEWCLKNRAEGWQAVRDVQVCRTPRGSTQPADDVIWANFDDGEVMVAGADTGTSLRLDGVGASMWRAVIASGNPDQAVAAVAQDYRVDRAVVRADLCALLADLRRCQLLK